ncbi:hypothetical protein [Mycobacteroides chelonae]|uniref:hypothetical protein n=1 Tax=Mycobacteroides chelonae TaxID=1774 RepID=UPI000993FF7A|nr:hypothetical protein [Mycobacteroides chelonae]
MPISRDYDGRDLQVGDPVSLRYGGIAHRGHVGENSHGTVIGFGRVNAQVCISDSRSADLIGTTVPVPPCHLKYGHVGYVRAADQLSDLLRELDEQTEKREMKRAETLLLTMIKLATEQGIITRQQGQQLWSLGNDLVPPPR